MWIPWLSNWIRKKRVKLAFRMGKKEHKYGRLIAIPILVGIFTNMIYLSPFVTPNINCIWFNLINYILIFIIWVIYLGSHTLEKIFFKKYGPRSNWGKKKK